MVLQDAASAFEAAVAAAGRQARPRDEPPASGTVWDEATDEGAPPLSRILLDPPAGAAEPAGSAGAGESAGADESAEPSGGPSVTGTDPGPPAASGPEGQNPA